MEQELYRLRTISSLARLPGRRQTWAWLIPADEAPSGDEVAKGGYKQVLVKQAVDRHTHRFIHQSEYQVCEPFTLNLTGEVIQGSRVKP